MQIVFCFVFIISCLQSFSQQSKIQGLVSIFNSETFTGKRQFVANAQIEDDFNKAQPTVTDDRGQFKLIYVGTKENESVYFQVKKIGLEVVNTDVLSAVAGQDEIVKVSMAKPNKVAEYRRQIYQIGKTEAEKFLRYTLKKKNSELTILRNNNLKNTAEINELKNQILELEDKINKIDEQATDLAKKYASINLDDVSLIVRSAFKLFQKGNLDSAQLLLSQADFPDKVESNLSSEKSINNERRINLQQKKDYSEGLQLKADFHKIRYQFDSVINCYNLMIKLDSTNADAFFAFARFLSWINQKDKAIIYNQKALEIYEKQVPYLRFGQFALASIFFNLGICYQDKNDFQNAELNMKKAFVIVKTYDERYPKRFLPDLAKLYVHLANLFRIKNDVNDAEMAFTNGLKIYDTLDFNHPKEYEKEISLAQNNFGVLYSDLKSFKKAEDLFLKALKIRQDLATKDPYLYTYLLATTMGNLGAMYLDKGDLQKAELFDQKTLKICRQLAKDNPATYLQNLAMAQVNSGLMYLTKNDLKKAEILYNEANCNYKILLKDNPDVYAPIFALLQNNMGLLYEELSDFDKAENFLILALCERRKLSVKYPEVYTLKVNLTAKNLLNLYVNKFMALRYESFKHDRQDKFKTIEPLLDSLSKQDSVIAKNLLDYYSDRSWYLLFANKYDEAERSAKEGLNIDASDKLTKMMLAHSLLLKGDYQEALPFYEEIKLLKNGKSKIYVTVCLNQLKELEKHGIINENFDKVRLILEKGN